MTARNIAWTVHQRCFFDACLINLLKLVGLGLGVLDSYYRTTLCFTFKRNSKTYIKS